MEGRAVASPLRSSFSSPLNSPDCGWGLQDFSDFNAVDVSSPATFRGTPFTYGGAIIHAKSFVSTHWPLLMLHQEATLVLALHSKAVAGMDTSASQPYSTNRFRGLSKYFDNFQSHLGYKFTMAGIAVQPAHACKSIPELPEDCWK